MTFDDLRTELLDRFESATYERPVEEVYAGLRRRRRRFRNLAVVAASLVMWEPFGRQSSAIAGWTPELHPGDPALVAQADAMCRTGMTPPGRDTSLPYPGELRWTHQRGNGLILAYPTPNGIGLFLTVIDDGVVRGGGSGSPFEFGPLESLLRVDGISAVGVFGTDLSSTGVTAVVGQATPEVDRIVVAAPGWTTEASQYDSYWLAWWPAITDASQITVAAYDDTGTLLETWTAGTHSQLANLTPVHLVDCRTTAVAPDHRSRRRRFARRQT